MKYEKKWTIIRHYRHSWLLWDDPLILFVCELFLSNPCLLTKVELQRLHRRFGYPLSDRLCRLLENLNQEVHISALDKLTRFYSHCQKDGKSLFIFRFTLQDEVEFNYATLVDFIYIGINPVFNPHSLYFRRIHSISSSAVARTCVSQIYMGLTKKLLDFYILETSELYYTRCRENFY